MAWSDIKPMSEIVPDRAKKHHFAYGSGPVSSRLGGDGVGTFDESADPLFPLHLDNATGKRPSLSAIEG